MNKEDILRLREVPEDRLKEIFFDATMMEEIVTLDPEMIVKYRGTREKVYEMAIRSGYVPNKEDLINSYNSFDNLCRSFSIMDKALEIDYNLVKYYKGADEDIFEKAITLGYVPTEEDLARSSVKCSYLGCSQAIIKKALKIDPSLIRYYKGEKEEVFEKAIAWGYVPNFKDVSDNENLNNSRVIFDYLLNYSEYSSNKFINYLKDTCSFSEVTGRELEIIGKFSSYDDLYQAYDYEFIRELCRYMVLNKEVDKEYKVFLGIIEKGDLELFNRFIDIFLGENRDIKEKINLMTRFVKKFEDYRELVCDVVEMEDLTNREKRIIRELFDDETISGKFNIKSLEELEVYNMFEVVRKKRRVRELVKEQNREGLIELLIDMLWEDKEKGKRIIEGKSWNFDSKTLGKFTRNDLVILKDKVSDSEVKKKIDNYIRLMDLIEMISSLEVEELGKGIRKLLDYSLEGKNNSLDKIYGLLEDGYLGIVKAYGQELKENLQDFSSLKERKDCNKGYRKIKSKYKASSKVIYKEDLTEKMVDYIELDGVSYTGLIHVMNAARDYITLEDLKKKRLKGKSYICTSIIGDDKIRIIKTEDLDDINHVTLFFNEIDASQLLTESGGDLYSLYGENSFVVGCLFDDIIDFKVVRERLKSGQSEFSEYILYRLKENGEEIYPTGVMVRGDNPRQNEIDAAAYLGVPLVKVKKDSYERKEEVMKRKRVKKMNNLGIKGK